MPVSGVDESEPQRANLGAGELAWVDLPCRDTNSTEPPLVLLHGFTGHRDDFIEVLPRLAERRRVIAPDLRGHGNSVNQSGPHGWGFDQFVKDLIALLDHLEIERCDLLGHSVGGFVALRFALAHPERVRTLIFLCTAPEVPTTLSKTALERAADIADARGIEGLQEIVEKAGRPEVSDTIRGWGERYWHHHRRRLGAMSPESYREIGRAFIDSPSLVERLSTLTHSTLVLVGEHDADWLPGADLFEQNLPRVDRITLDDAEHHPHQENSSAWLEAVEAHLAESAQQACDSRRENQPLAEAHERNSR